MHSFCPPDYLAIRTAPEILQLTFDSEDSVDYYRILERKIARFFRVESVLFFPDAYLALVALLRNLIQEDDILFIPPETDGTIPDALEIVQRQFEKIRIQTLTEQSLELLPPGTSRVVILTNGICENNGEIAPVDVWTKKLEELYKKTHIASLIILDDASGAGILGKNYRGTFEHFKISANHLPDSNAGVQYFFSTSMNDAIGSSGGLLVGDRKWLKAIRRTEPCCCSRSEMPLSNVVAAAKAFDLVLEPERHERLKKNRNLLCSYLRKYEIPYESNALLPFVLIKVPNPKDLVKGMGLRGCRIGLTHFTRKASLCLAVNSAHTESDIEFLVQALSVEMHPQKDDENSTEKAL